MGALSIARSKWRAIRKATIWGAVLFGAITLDTHLGIAYLGWHSREGPDLSAFVVGAVPYLVANTLGLVDAPEDSFVHSVVFQLIVNMLLGAAIFFLGAFFWQTSKLEQKPD